MADDPDVPDEFLVTVYAPPSSKPVDGVAAPSSCGGGADSDERVGEGSAANWRMMQLRVGSNYPTAPPAVLFRSGPETIGVPQVRCLLKFHKWSTSFSPGQSLGIASSSKSACW